MVIANLNYVVHEKLQGNQINTYKTNVYIFLESITNIKKSRTSAITMFFFLSSRGTNSRLKEKNKLTFLNHWDYKQLPGILPIILVITLATELELGTK